MKGEKWVKRLGFSVVLVLAWTQACMGGGFALYEMSARGNALEGTLVGRADDPSALYFNPAGITQLPGLQMQAGATAFLPSADITTTSGGKTTTTSLADNVWVTPNLFSTYQLTDRVWLGLAAFTQFGLGTEYDSNWPGRYNGYKGVVQSLTVNPNIAFKLNDQLSFAGGFDIMWFSLEVKQKIDVNPYDSPVNTAFDVDQTLKGDSFGYGYNFALHYKPLNWLAFGISYRSRVKQALSGEATFQRPATVSPLFFNDTDVSGSITLPDMLFTGVVVKPVDRLSIEFTTVLTRWSTYDDFAVSYSPNPFPLGPRGGVTLTSLKDWHDAWRYEVGAEYRLLDWLDLRLGYVYDETPDPASTISYLTPISDCQAVSFGPGFRLGSWTLDLSYVYVFGDDRDVPARPQEFVLPSKIKDLQEHLFALSVGYRF